MEYRSRPVHCAFAFLSGTIYNIPVSGKISQKEKVTLMFRCIAGFFRRLFNSRGFQRGLLIFLGVFIVYYFYNVIIYLRAVMNTGASLGEALRFYFSLPLFYADWVPPSAGIALGIAIGLVLYFNRKRINSEKAEPDEKPEESSDVVREEEIIETTHYKYQ
jgi:hypothetical protein